MGSNSILNGSVPAFSKDFGKKKRTNRIAKLKQCKLDARREQWLSQAKNKGCMEESKVGGGSPPSASPLTDEPNLSLGNSEMRSRGEESEVSSHHSSDVESLANSPTSSFLGANDSGKDRPGSSSGSSNGNSSFSGNFSVGEEDDGCLDDWEVVADALTADDKLQHKDLEHPAQEETPVGSNASPELPNKACGVGVLKSECQSTPPRVPANNCAWRPDDASRPQSLPNLSKQYSFPMNAERHCGRGSNNWALTCQSIISQPSSCPICYEDLDLTDSSFLPCSCGFRLCLFCHKRILEADGRCPGCRKQYNPIHGETGVNVGAPPFRLARSFSMSTRP